MGLLWAPTCLSSALHLEISSKEEKKRKIFQVFVMASVNVTKCY